MSILLLIIVFVVIAFTLVIVSNARKKKLVQEALQQQAALAQIKQEAVLKELDILGNLIDDATLTYEEKSKKANASFNIIESHNLDGMFTEIIKETKDYIAKELCSKHQPKPSSKK